MSGREPEHRVRCPVNLQDWLDLTFLPWRYEPDVVQRLMPDGLEVQALDGLRFLSLDCPRLVVVVALRAVDVPYLYARARMTPITGAPTGLDRALDYRFVRPAVPVLGVAPASFSARVVVGEPLSPAERTPLVDSLTGRWGAYVRRVGRTWRVPVSYEVWPLRRAEVEGDLTRLLLAAGLPEPADPPMTHFSPGVHSRIGLPGRPDRLGP